MHVQQKGKIILLLLHGAIGRMGFEGNYTVKRSVTRGVPAYSKKRAC